MHQPEHTAHSDHSDVKTSETTPKSSDLETTPSQPTVIHIHININLPAEYQSKPSPPPTNRKAGGFVIKGKDRLRRNLMETRSGTLALHIFSRIGQLHPVYLSNEFYSRTKDA